MNTHTSSNIHGYICHICNKDIAGVRYECAACSGNKDICAKCYRAAQQGIYAGHWIDARGRPPQDGYACNGCGEDITGVKYECQRCDDVDYCERCIEVVRAQRGKHHKHAFKTFDE